MLSSYRICDLVMLPHFLPQTGAGIQWEDRADLDWDSKTYQVVTTEGSNFTFDLTTGRLTSLYSPERVKTGALVLLLIAAIAWVRRWRRRRAAAKAG